MPFKFSGATWLIVILAVIAVWVASSNFKQVRTAESSASSPSYFWGKKCEASRSDWKRWEHDGTLNKVRVCPGGKLVFYGKYQPSITEVEAENELRIGSFSLPCRDLFARETRDLDIVVCWTGKYLPKNSTAMLAPPTSNRQWLLKVRDTDVTKQYSRDGIELQIGVHVETPKPPPPKERPKQVPAKQSACPQKFYRTTGCVKVNFTEIGATYHMPKRPRDTSGRKYCAYTKGTRLLSKWVRPDGGWSFQANSRGTVQRDRMNYDLRVFFFLAPGEHISGAVCPG